MEKPLVKRGPGLVHKEDPNLVITNAAYALAFISTRSSADTVFDYKIDIILTKFPMLFLTISRQIYFCWLKDILQSIKQGPLLIPN